MRITAHDINFTIDSRTIFDGVSLDVPSGTAMALTGPSGSGKTTLFNCLSLLLPVSRGEILIDGTDVTRLSEGRRRRFWRDSVAFVFQDYGLVPDESVGFNVCMESSPLFRKPKKWGAGVEDALNRVGLTGRASEQVAKLSGGERQRVGIARAIHKKAKVIFADEPTASLDVGNRQIVHDLLLGEKARGATIVISTHDDHLSSACDAVFRLASSEPEPDHLPKRGLSALQSE